ncbi:hypothetical protein WA026_015013 [Henosepilachna vigintioctopunctata]|uniref:Uncharacterized protein n=1 Tax=Henosepilachna vigintioctopunctata TaxID=420089 RepID=A0AAW1TYW5_9CUCU
MEVQNTSTNFFTTALPSVLHNTIKRIPFSWYDYALFCSVLSVSCMTGIYFGCVKKQNTKKDYLLGGKQMKTLPVAISLIASHTSAITVLAIPADVYRYGIGFWQGCVSLFLLHFITYYIYLPVFYKLDLTSTYEYLALRFDEKTRMMASALYALSLLLYLPIVIYVPSLGFATATGLNIHLVVPIACGICVFYTTIGGLKALVWTDTFQFSLTIGCLATVLWLGLKQTGGFISMWNTSIDGHRLDIDFDPDPTKRDSFWTVAIGLTFMFTAQNSINQGCIQKFLSLPSLQAAKISCFTYVMGCILAKTLSVLIGLTMYAIYVGCDPFTTKQVTRNDELVPFFIMHVANTLPGLSGLFFAGVFCAALSTLSGNLNCVSGTLYTDFISKLVSKDISEKMTSNILKLIVVISGICGWLMVFVIENLGGMVQLSVSLKGIAEGPLLGIFTMGMMCKKFNSKGAFYGMISGMVFMTWLFLMSKYYENHGYHYEPKPLSIDDCPDEYKFSVNNTLSNTVPSVDNVFILFKISFYYYSMLGCLVTMLIGTVISLFTQSENAKFVPLSLLTPIIHWMYEQEDEEALKLKKDVYLNIEEAMKVVECHVDKKENKNT